MTLSMPMPRAVGVEHRETIQTITATGASKRNKQLAGSCVYYNLQRELLQTHSLIAS